MPRRRRPPPPAVSMVFSFLASLHWGILLVLSAAAFFGLRIYASGQASTGIASLITPFEQFWRIVPYVGAGLFLVLAVVSFFRALSRRNLLDRNTTLAKIEAMDWRAFERLVGEAYRRQGYAVKETGQGGADGGVDLLLTKGGKTTIVQCKQWRSRSIGAPTVREMWGLAHHHGASAVKIVGVGQFTPAAHDFARGKPLDLVSGADLVELIQGVSTGASPGGAEPVTRPGPRPATPPRQPACPSCQAAMCARVSRKDGARFWGCSRYPSCKATKPMVGGR